MAQELHERVVRRQCIGQTNIGQRLKARTNNTRLDRELDQLAVVLDIAKAIIVALRQTKLSLNNRNHLSRSVYLKEVGRADHALSGSVIEVDSVAGVQRVHTIIDEGVVTPTGRGFAGVAVRLPLDSGIRLARVERR